MSQSERKMLVAKRHGERPPNRHRSDHSSNFHNSAIQGVKRYNDSDETEQPPHKRLNTNGPQTQNRSPKNLAERRLLNLRKNLESHRRQSETSCSTFALNSPNGKKPLVKTTLNTPPQICSTPITSPRIENPILNTSSENLSPIQNRLKRKSCENTTLISPLISNVSQSSVPNLSLNIPNSNINNTKKSNVEFTEEMDWTEIDEITAVKDINELRKEINYNKELPDAQEIDDSIPTNADGIFVVVDTNIFLSHLNLLMQLKEKHFSDFGQVTIVVPWMVIQELDYMKESHSRGCMMKSARKAVHYINSQLANKDPNFTGQSVMDAAKLELSSKNPDDGILFSCLQLVEKKKFVILLSNDTNLRNKALVNKVPSYSSSEIITNLNNLKPNKEEKNYFQAIQKIKILLSNLLTHIIQCEMKEAYGDIWHKMALMHPPFTTEEALNCLIKYWCAVFSFSLQKQCKLKIEAFSTFLKHHRNVSSFQIDDFNKFVEYSLCLCIYLKNGYKKYVSLITECIVNIQNCAET